MSGVTTYGLPDFSEVEIAMASDAPRRWGLVSERGLSVAVEPASHGLWLLCPVTSYQEPESITKIIEVKQWRIAGSALLAIGTRQPAFLREVYYFLCGVVHRAESSTDNIQTIVEGEIAAWAAILTAPKVLDVKSQTGLLGELWVLWRVIGNSGSNGGVGSWTGPSREQHDFQMANEDLEVKTTLAHHRNHVINGLTQLTVKQGRPLFIVSVQLRPAGDGLGVTIPEAYDSIIGRLDPHRRVVEEFKLAMEACGYVNDNRQLYTTRFALRSQPMVIEVDDALPRITEESVVKGMDTIAAARLREVTYVVNLDGLGQDIDECDLPRLMPRAAGDLYG